MRTRRAFCTAFCSLLGSAAGVRPWRCAAQESDEDLPNRGAPTGRVGAATRGWSSDGADLRLDLVAPATGVGLTASSQPTLFYLLGGGNSGPLRFTLAQHGQARPVADLTVPAPSACCGLGRIDLRAHNVRLTPNERDVWSVVIRLDPTSPSHDLVASALIQYRPSAAVLDAALRTAATADRCDLLARSGYWYDAVAAAAEAWTQDHGVALNRLLRETGLPVVAASGPGRLGQ